MKATNAQLDRAIELTKKRRHHCRCQGDLDRLGLGALEALEWARKTDNKPEWLDLEDHDDS